MMNTAGAGMWAGTTGRAGGPHGVVLAPRGAGMWTGTTRRAGGPHGVVLAPRGAGMWTGTSLTVLSCTARAPARPRRLPPYTTTC